MGNAVNTNTNIRTASLSGFTSNMVLSASSTRFNVGTSLSFAYGSAATYNFYNIASLTLSYTSGKKAYWKASNGQYSGYYLNRNLAYSDMHWNEFHFIRCKSTDGCYNRNNA